MTQEIWKDVVGYEGLYQVSNLGRVKSVKRIVKNGKIFKTVNEKIMTQLQSRNGYSRVYLKNQGKGKNKSIHRLVAEAFIPNPHDYPQVNHIDEDKRNNKVDNLEWCTSKYNSSYGSRPRKLAIANSKPVIQYNLSGEYVSEYSSVKCAAEYLNVNASSIYTCVEGIHKIAYGYRWAYK